MLLIGPMLAQLAMLPVWDTRSIASARSRC